MDFTTTVAAAKPGTVRPDPIVYQPSGIKAWAVRTFAAPMDVAAALDVEAPRAEQQKAPTAATFASDPLKDLMPGIERASPKHPLAVSDSLPFEEQRRREIINLAFERIGTGQYENADIFLRAAKYEAGGGADVDAARDFLDKTVAGDRATKGTLLDIDIGRMDKRPDPGRIKAASDAATRGYKALNAGDYNAAGAAFAEANRHHPHEEWKHRMRQSDLALLLQGR